MHNTVLLLLWYECVLFTNKVWELIFLNSIALPSFMHISLPITSTCMFPLFFVAKKRYCLPSSYPNIGVISLNATCLSSFMHPSTQVRELHKHACLILMYGPKLFFVVFQKVRCLHKL